MGWCLPCDGALGLVCFQCPNRICRRLAVITGMVEVTHAEEIGVPLDQVNRFDTAANLLGALQGGRIDAAALTTISFGSLAQTSDFAGVEVTEGFAYQGRLGCGACGFRQEDIRFRDDFNLVLNWMRDDGEDNPSRRTLRLRRGGESCPRLDR